MRSQSTKSAVHSLGPALLAAWILVGCAGPPKPVYAPSRPPLASMTPVDWVSACGAGNFVGTTGGFVTPTSIYLRDMMSAGSFRLTALRIVIDGAPICEIQGEEAVTLAEGQIGFLNGALSAGEHKVDVVLNYRGEGHGVFEYLKAYRFKITSTRKIIVGTEPLCVEIVAFEKGSATSSLEERPRLAFDVAPCGAPQSVK